MFANQHISYDPQGHSPGPGGMEGVVRILGGNTGGIEEGGGACGVGWTGKQRYARGVKWGWIRD